MVHALFFSRWFQLMRIWDGPLLPSQQGHVHLALALNQPQNSGEWHRSAARWDFPCRDQCTPCLQTSYHDAQLPHLLEIKMQVLYIWLSTIYFIFDSTAASNLELSRVSFPFAFIKCSWLKTWCLQFSVCFPQILHSKDGFSFSA